MNKEALLLLQPTTLTTNQLTNGTSIDSYERGSRMILLDICQSCGYQQLHEDSLASRRFMALRVYIRIVITLTCRSQSVANGQSYQKTKMDASENRIIRRSPAPGYSADWANGSECRRLTV